MSDSFLHSLPEDERAAFIEGVFDLARGGRTAQLLEMLESGVPLNVTNARRDTLLTVATYAQQHATVLALIEYGVPLNAVNAMGQTAVSCAVFRGDLELLAALLDAGADPHAGAHSAEAIARQFNLEAVSTYLSQRFGN